MCIVREFRTRKKVSHKNKMLSHLWNYSHHKYETVCKLILHQKAENKIVARA